MTEEIQGNISALLNGQAQLVANLEKLKEENASLRKLVREAYFDDVENGKMKTMMQMIKLP